MALLTMKHICAFSNDFSVGSVGNGKQGTDFKSVPFFNDFGRLNTASALAASAVYRCPLIHADLT